MSKNKSLLMISRYYYPYFEAGGPVKSTKNFLSFHSSKYNITLFTSNESLLETNEKTLNNKIFYLKKIEFLKKMFFELYINKSVDIVYINSFFNFYSFSAILICSFSNLKLFIHSRGVLKQAQINHKKIKKILYIFFIKFFCKRFTFLVNESGEKKTIKKYFLNPKIKYAYNYVDVPRNKITYSNNKFLFYSRISSEKGLLFLLKLIKKYEIDIDLDFYGNIWDDKYFEKCNKLISSITCSKINYKGIIKPEKIDEIISKYHCLVLPTRGENFGHVIYESLKNSVPVISSENIPWELSKRECGVNLKMDHFSFKNQILRYKNMDVKNYKLQKQNALNYSMEYYKSQKFFKINNE